MKKPVTQEHSMGCGVACTAYILNCTYQQALKLYNNPQQAWKKGFYCREIIMALQKAGKAYSYKKYTPSEQEILNIPDTIVFIEKSHNYPAGHFLARTSEASWMNPWINFPLIAPAESGFQAKLPGNPAYIIFPLPSNNPSYGL